MNLHILFIARKSDNGDCPEAHYAEAWLDLNFPDWRNVKHEIIEC